LVALLIVSGLASLLSFVRVGVQRFWTPQERPSPLLRWNECIPIVLLLGACIVLTFKAQALLHYTQDTAQALHDPQQYILSVSAAKPLSGPTTAANEQVQP
jgi:multicomponent K+:H+ antiporter subunit D